MALFGWDELSNEITRYDNEDDLRKINKEGGWQYKETLPNGVAVLMTDHHLALEVHAIDEADAHSKFRAHKIFRDYNEYD